MIVTVPPRLEDFCRHFQDVLTETRQTSLAWLLAGFLLARGKRTQSAVGRQVLSRERSPAAVSRRMRRDSFRTRDLVRAEMKRQIARELQRVGGAAETWLLAIDGVCMQRGGETKIPNAIQYKKKKRGSKGRSTKAHTFVQGILITASGARIPLPRRSYYTRKYVQKENKRRSKDEPMKQARLVFKTQVELSSLMVKELDLPEHIRLVVVADEYFEGQQLTSLCRQKGYVFIAPCNSRRNLESGGKLYAKGKALARSAYRKLILRRGEEETASHRRQTLRGAGEKDRRVYRFHCERRAVARTGEASVVYSWKRRRNRSGRLTSRETFKVLVCSDPTIPGAQIIEWFEMRWAVEVFFRELKSDLGFGDYQGADFHACERHVDLVLLSFMFLEEMRCREMARTRSPVKKREWSGLRTSGLLRKLQREAHASDISWINELLKAKGGKADVERVIPAVTAAA